MKKFERIKCSCKLRRVHVKNFKSLKDFTLEFDSNLQVVIGPNASGKSNVIELFQLLKNIIKTIRGQIYNPFLDWWGYSNVVWMSKETLPIEIELCLECSDVFTTYLNEGIIDETDFKSSYHLNDLIINYKIAFSGTGGSSGYYMILFQ